MVTPWALVAFLLAPASEPQLPEHPDVEVAKAAYNGKRYNEAARRFLKLAQRWPRNAALYRALARARSWAGDPGGAVVAYGFYLDLAREAPDRQKVQAELELAGRSRGRPLRRVHLPKPPPSSRARRAVRTSVTSRRRTVPLGRLTPRSRPDTSGPVSGRFGSGWPRR